MEKVKIPVPMTLEIDDVGWDCGYDLRLSGRASRSGLPRYHAKEDYEVIRGIADKSKRSIAIALCLGDWDKDNLLRGEVGITHDPHGWDRADEIDIAKFEEYRDILESSEHIEYILHGLLHGIYDEEGKRLHEKEFYHSRKAPDGKTESYVDEADVRRRFDLFFKIYNSWGFKKPVRGFVSPCAVSKNEEENLKMAKILRDYGITYWADDFSFPEPLRIYEGIACFHWIGGGERLPWQAYDCDPGDLGNHYDEKIINTCFRGNHWTNFLRYSPKKNATLIDPWVDYLKRQSEVFGCMTVPTVSESVNQMVYYALSKIEKRECGYDIDISDALSSGYLEISREFFISFDRESLPKSCTGGEMSLYEEHEKFCTYKIVATEERVSICL